MVVIVALLAIIFTVLAMKNWNRMIGAGPTILIIGTIFLFGFVGVAYSQHLYDLRSYDNCLERRDRRADQYRFDNALVSIVEVEFPKRTDIVEELRSVMISPSDESSCGSEPAFLTLGGN